MWQVGLNNVFLEVESKRERESEMQGEQRPVWVESSVWRMKGKLTTPGSKR